MPAPVTEGDVLAGKYRVDKVLGVGGMGVVVAAHHIQLDEKVALKFLLPDALENPEAVERFRREARAAFKIKSEHVARVTDVGELESGSPYLVMEYLDGSDLSAWLHQRGALPVEQAVELVLQACEAIAEAHSLGIVHRDLKPANLFCVQRPDGEIAVKVLDFGISKSTSPGGSGLDMGMTSTMAIMGSPLYMSPEQMQSAKSVDARTDIWAIGVILYELLTGQPPFGGETLTELVFQVGSAQPRPMRELRPDVPAGLEAVVLRCLEKKRDERYANVAELAVALAGFGPARSGRSVERISRVIESAGLSSGVHALPTAVPPSEATAGTVASWGRTKPGGSSRKTRVGLAIAAIVLLGGAVLLYVRGAVLNRATAVGSPTGSALPAVESSQAVVQLPASSVAQTVPAPSSAPPESSTAATAAAGADARAAETDAAVAGPTPRRAPATSTPATRKPAPASSVYNPLDHL